MDFTSVVVGRESVRKYDGRKPSEEQLERILEAGRWAPTAFNKQPQRVFVLESESALAKMDQVHPCRYDAQLVLLVCGDSEIAASYEGNSTAMVDATIAATHMLLAAYNEGVDSVWAGVHLPEETRKDPAARADALNSAAVSFLCLPDAAAIEAASFVTSPNAVIIDTSTAHRVAEGWTYGMPELTGQREKLKAAKRIANPGCHATGFISLVAPLVEAGLLKKDVRLSSFSLTGYSGGGKKMIAEYEAENVDPLYQAPRQYGLGQTHKHLPEMAKLCGLDYAPVFCPIVAPYYAGMEVTVPLTSADTSASIEEIKEAYKAYYQSGLIRFADAPDENGFLSAGAFAGRDDLQVSVYGNEERHQTQRGVIDGSAVNQRNRHHADEAGGL